MTHPAPSKRIPFLDVVRAAAILMVALHHYSITRAASVPRPEIATWILERAYIGVDLFFVLSGWLIGGQLFRSVRTSQPDARSIGAFWLRRWLRTLPNYFVVLPVIFWLSPTLGLPDLPWFSAFTQNYTNPFEWVITWSLCVEEHFYLVLPLVVLMALRLDGKWRWALLLSALALSPLLRAWVYARLPDSERTITTVLRELVFPTHVRLDGLALGVGLAAAREWSTPMWAFLTRHAGAFAAVGLGLLAFHWNPWFVSAPEPWSYRCTFYYSVLDSAVVAAGVGLLFPWGVQRASLRVPGARFVSEHAYATYLTHDVVMRYLNRFEWMQGHYWGPLVACGAAIFGVAFVLRSTVEQPVLHLRDRWLPHGEGRQNDAVKGGIERKRTRKSRARSG